MSMPDWFYDAMRRVKPDRPKRPRPTDPVILDPDPVDPRPDDRPNLNGSTSGAQIASCGAQMSGKQCRYVWAKAGPCRVGFDCAGLTNYCVKIVTGRDIGRSGEHQMHSAGLTVVGRDGHLDLSVLRPGDLLFWHTGVVHVGIYAGDRRMHNALNENQGLATSVIAPSTYWGSGAARYLGARRVA